MNVKRLLGIADINQKKTNENKKAPNRDMKGEKSLILNQGFSYNSKPRALKSHHG